MSDLRSAASPRRLASAGGDPAAPQDAPIGEPPVVVAGAPVVADRRLGGDRRARLIAERRGRQHVGCDRLDRPRNARLKASIVGAGRMNDMAAADFTRGRRKAHGLAAHLPQPDHAAALADRPTQPFDLGGERLDIDERLDMKRVFVEQGVEIARRSREFAGLGRSQHAEATIEPLRHCPLHGDDTFGVRDPAQRQRTAAAQCRSGKLPDVASDDFDAFQRQPKELVRQGAADPPVDGVKSVGKSGADEPPLRPEAPNPTRSASRTTTLTPRRARPCATESPASPPPTTATSEEARRQAAVAPAAATVQSSTSRRRCAATDVMRSRR